MVRMLAFVTVSAIMRRYCVCASPPHATHNNAIRRSFFMFVPTDDSQFNEAAGHSDAESQVGIEN